MLENYLKTAIRNLWRKKGSTFINISGLSLGIAGSLVLFLIIGHHTSFDNYHSKADRIYRVVHSSKGNTGDDYTSGVPTPFPDAFRNDFPEAEEIAFTQYHSGGMVTIPTDNASVPKKYGENKGIVFTEPSLFRIFDFKVLIGDAQKSLDDPNEAVISKSLALKYFGKEDATGEIVKFDNKEFKIGAVIEDPPANTDMPFSLILSYVTIEKTNEEKGWNSIWSDEQCYFLLKEGEKAETIDSRMKAFVTKYRSAEEAEESTFFAQPLKTFHSDERFSNYNYNTISPSVLIVLIVIASLLIVTACINFVNLATAEAIKRSKEVGIRKSLGSTRSQLVGQFLGETTLVTIASVGIALFLAWGGLRFLNPFLELNLTLGLLDNPMLWAFIAGITVIVSLFSGLYPSFVLSAFNPVAALKSSSVNKNSSGYTLRRVLVIAQFSISQLLIIGTIVLIDQMNFLTTKELGFKRDAIINVQIPVREEPTGPDGSSKMKTLKNEVLGLAGVQMASLNSSPPSSGNVSGTNFHIEGKEEDLGTQVKEVDGDYLKLYEMELLAGENIADLDTATGFLVNEKLVKMAGYKEANEGVGKEIRMWGKRFRVTGVVKDFHTVSLSSAIEPVILLNRLRGYRNMSVKLHPASMQETIKQIQTKWEATYPDAIFGFEFLDEEIRNFYNEQKRMSVLLSIFTTMAIFIGCLGLFGLATFMANQKTKEIGIRKVLGASVGNIVFIFSREFIVLIFAGFVLAAPVAWIFMNQFLEQFQYRIEPGPTVFVIGVGLTIVIAALTVGFRSFKAATVNPVDSLKCE